MSAPSSRASQRTGCSMSRAGRRLPRKPFGWIRERLGIDVLERRYALAATPTATVAGPVLSGLIGQDIPLTVTFDNTGTDIGYSPFVDIVMPATGDAPPTPNDGISFKPGSASYNGLSLVTTVLTFNAAGEATHPFAKNPDGSSVVVTGKPGDQLVVVQLPFGSYGPDQPAAVINFTGSVSPLAQPNNTYDVTATGGFQYQVDGSGNPTINVADFGSESTDPVQPQLFRIKKTSTAPEGETATGPNFTHSYTVSIAVAPGQTVTDMLLSDVLPNNLQFVSVTTVSGNGTTTITPVSTPTTSTPGGTLSRRLDQVVGTGSASDAVMTFTYFVPEKDASNADVIPLGTGGTAVAVNTSSAEGKWTSANPNFPDEQTVTSSPTDPDSKHTLTAKTTALQKTVADLTHPGSPRAGDTLEYTLNFQVSDYFALSDFILADVLTDGQEFDASFTPTITYTQKSQTLTSTFDSANFSAIVQADGSTNVDFDVSAQVDALGLLTDGKLVGAGIPNTGTGSPSTLPNPTPSGPGTRGTITFRTKILNQYRQTPRPGADVVQGDVIADNADTSATVLDYANLAPTASTVADTSSASVTLVSGSIGKSVYAVNGTNVSGTPTITAGDAVTFRITYDLPFSSIKDYTITDFLPLPIFAAQGLTFAGGGSTATAPASGQWKFGPTDTYSTISGIIPTVSFNAAANSETWDFGTFQDTLDQASTTDILFTVTATSRPFGDGLLLTNQAEQQERNETGDLLTSNTALAQVKVSEPLLGITKGVVSTNNPAGVFAPPTVAPPGVTFSKPGIAGASFTGTVTSGGLATQPIDSTLSNVVGNDLVKFCIIVENTGSGQNGAFDVSFNDIFDATKMQIPTNATGLNLRITDGAGTLLPYTGSLFGAGITLTDPSSTTGSLDPGKTTAGTVINTGNNIAVITYDLQLLPTVLPLDVIPNTATLTNYASTEGGPNFLPPDGISDETTVTVTSPAVLKSLVDTSIIDANNSRTQAVIGELATFELTVRVPEGTTPNAIVVDTLPAGLAFVQMVGTPVVDPGITVDGSTSPSNPVFTPVVTNSGRTLTFTLGDIVNTNPDRQLHGFTLRYQTVVLNVSSNISNKTLTNSAKLTWTDHTELPAAKSSPVTVIEPKLKIDKTVDKSTAQAGDTVTFTILVSHTGQSQTDAYNVDLSDVIPAGMTYVAASLQNTAGVVPTSLSDGSTLTATYDKLAKGATSTLTFQATLDANVIAGQSIVNTVNETWTSLPGDPGQITPNNPNAYERTGDPTEPGQLNNYKASDPATVTVAQPSVSKALVTTSIVDANNSATQAVIGETATYTVTMTIPQGRTPAAKLIDSLPAGMAYVQTISAVNNDPTFLTVPGLANAPTLGSGAQTFTYDLGDIVNTDTDSTTDETITFTIEAVVLNVNSNVSGTSLVNQAQATWNAGRNTSPTVSSGAVTVIEPKLLVQKTKSVGGFGGNVGDPVTYTITISNYGITGTDAYNTTLDDAIPAAISGVAIASVVDSTGNATTANFGLAGNTLSTTTPFTVPKGNTVTITVTGTLTGPLTAGQQIVNTAYGEWTSLPGDPGQITPNNPNAYERTGSGSTSLGQLNNYHASGETAITPNSADLAVVKTVSNAAPNVGDTITFTVTVSNNGPNTAHSVQLTDSFPVSAELTYVSATPSQGSYDAGTGVWTVGTVNVGAANKQTLTITATVNAPTTAGALPATQTNTATVTGAGEPDPNPGNNTGTATLTPLYADLAVTKTVDNPQPNVGDTITYTVTLTNIGTATATGVEVTDALPANVTFVSATPQSGTTFTPTPAVSPTGGVWAVPTIAPGASLILTITATADAPGVSFNTVTITKSSTYDPNEGNNTAKTPTDPQEADLVVTKTVDSPRPQVGDNVTFTVKLQNLGPSTAASVVVADAVTGLTGLQFVSATASAGAYDENTGDWTLGSVASGAVETLTIVATVLTPSSGSAPSQTNTATATSTTPDPNPGNNTGTATETPLQADLAVFKIVSDPTPNVGDTIEFAIGVANYGPDTATQVVVNDQLPAGVTFVSYQASQGTYDSGTGVWTIGTVTTADFPVLVITATVDRPVSGAPAPVTNTATVSGREFDPNPGNNTDSVTETPQYADLAVDKQVSDATPNVGDTITYTITLSNLGADTATGVTILDQVPAGLQFVSAQPSQGTYTVGTGIWDVGTVDTVFPRTLTIQAIVLAPSSGAPQPQTNTASVQTSNQYDPDPSNNTDSVTETPKYADLKVEKVVDDARPNVGDTITFTITLSNLGKDTATDVTIADTLPAGLAFLSATPAQGSYDSGTGIWDVGSLAASGSTTLTITVLVVSGVAQTNVASVASANEFDPDKTNNTSSVTETPLSAELSVTKGVVSATPIVGDTVTYTIVVHNAGPDAAVNTIASDVFPTTGLANIVAGTPSQGTYDPVTGDWDLGDLASGANATITFTALTTLEGSFTNTVTVSTATFEPDLTNNTAQATITVLASGVIIGSDLGCTSTPLVRVIDPNTGVDRITPFFAYEPKFRGGVHVYGADVTGDGIPEILTAPGHGRPGEVRVFSRDGTPLPQYNFFPFGASYRGGVEIAVGSITGLGKTEIVAGQNRGGLARVFTVNPGVGVNSAAIRQVQPFGAAYRSGVMVATADIGTFSGRTLTSSSPDGISEMVFGSGPGIQASVREYNGVPAKPVLVNAFNAIAKGYNRGVSVARLPGASGAADGVLVSAGPQGGSKVQTFRGISKIPAASFAAYSGSARRADVFTAAISETEIFSVQGQFGATPSMTSPGVKKNTAITGGTSSTLRATGPTALIPPLRVGILRK
jgi:large repetitive protein